MKNLRNQRGQALLIVVLVMAVALTIGLAVVSRSITDIKISRQEEESSRVFSVAEAGIEEALKLGSGTSGTISEISYTVSETAQGGGTEFVFPKAIEAGDTQTLWLVEHEPDGDLIQTAFYTAGGLSVCWEDTDPETALEVSILYKDAGVYKIARGAYDTEAASRGNSFDPPDAGDCAGLGRKKTLTWTDFGITLDSNTFLISLRLRPIYNQAKIGAVGVGGSGGILPSQGKCYESTASLSTSGITRKVQQCQFHKTPPGIFDYVLFSEGGLTK